MLAQLLLNAKRNHTLYAKVDNDALRAVRLALRRKYASRTNLDRIWSQWCKDESKGLSFEDLFMGLNKIGVGATLDQAKALFFHSKLNLESETLSKEEFDKLIFSTDENLPADLKKYAPADKNAELQLTTKLFQDKMFSRIDLESLSPEILAKFRIRNKWRMCLQRAIQNISKDLLDADKDRTY